MMSTSVRCLVRQLRRIAEPWPLDHCSDPELLEHFEVECDPEAFAAIVRRHGGGVLLCYLEGLSRDEAAQQLGVTTAVLRGRLERGRDRLRLRLTGRGITLSVGLIFSGIGLARYGTPPVPASSARSAEEAKGPERVAAGPQQTLPADNKPVAVSGKVVGPDELPVPGAKLFVCDSEEWKPAPQRDTNADGGFAFDLPPLADRRSYRYLVATAPDLGLGCDWTGVAA